jgi:NitT/TauT family transport system substrate-binding protein
MLATAILSAAIFVMHLEPLEAAELRITNQPSLTSLPLMLMQNDRLIEKQAQKSGIDAKVSWLLLSGGNVANDVLLSGNADIVATSPASLLTLLDKSHGKIDIRGISAYSRPQLELLTRSPNIKSISDLTDKDRIALPAAKVSTQATALEMAAAGKFGIDQYAKFDSLVVSRGHPDAVAAFLSDSEINLHFSAPPYLQDELKVPGVRSILSTTDKDVFGGPFSSGIIYGTGKFRRDNPELYAAVLLALQEAIEIIKSDAPRAAKAYLDVTKEKRTVEEVVAIIRQPGLDFSMTPSGMLRYASFMKQTGRIQIEITDWKQLYFPEIYDRPGS